MNTDPKNQERVQGLQLHPELAVSNTNPRKLYDVTVYRGDYFSTKFRVKASSEREAETEARELSEQRDISKWDVTDRELYHFDIEQVKEGGRHV